MKKGKKLILLLVITLIFPLLSHNMVDAAIMVPQTTHSWSYSLGAPYTSTGSWSHIYTGAPAAKKGEYDTISYSVSYSHTFSGSIATDLKKNVQAQLGYSFGVSKSFSIAKNSAPLEKGQYVKAYYAKAYEVTPIYQVDSQHTTGWKQNGAGGSYEYVDYYTTERSTAYGKKALYPQIKLEYHMTSSTKSYNSSNSYVSLNQINTIESQYDDCTELDIDNDILYDVYEEDIVKTEIYEYKDGEYHLISTDYTFME